MYDVIVVGGGPGGSVAAKRCVRNGFKTLLVERKQLPRDKVCSGMVMGPWANDIIQQEFGPIPQDVLIDPRYLSGHIFYVPGVPPQVLSCETPLAWRKDLDFWMIQKAQREGVEIWDAAKVIRVNQKDSDCIVILKRGENQQELRTRFVIGADGASSVVRKCLFPKLKIRYSVPIRECYEGSLDLAKVYFHWFFPKSRPRPRFNLNHKGDVFLIEGSGIEELRGEINQILGDYGFDPDTKPLWKDGCLIPRLHEALISGDFFPAQGNILLIGDAAGLLFPITFEGIGSALKSGIIAADAIHKAAKQGKTAAKVYLEGLLPIQNAIKGLIFHSERLMQNADKGPEVISMALKKAYGATLKIS
jgi:flavin-dependent dehydrogenase